MKKVFHNRYERDALIIDGFIDAFENSGASIKDSRNKLKLFEMESEVVNIKSFKVPNLINQIIYKHFRKGKAQRSFEFANTLIEMGIGTPMPIAYYEFSTPFLFKKSYYVSAQLDCDLTYRELIRDLNFPNHEQILREFTQFTFKLHEKGIHFLDHSPGNTLIKANDNHYDFSLVDLNRMKFGPMSFETRIENFSRLTKSRALVETMSDEYSKCIGKDYDTVFNLMWQSVESFQHKIQRKKRFKKLIGIGK